MTVPFGFSIGDFVTVGHLVWKLYEAIKDTKGTVAEFQVVERELLSFHRAIVGVEQLLRSGMSVAEADASNIRDILKSCQDPILEFQTHLEQYKSILGSSQRNSLVARTKWKFSGKTKIGLFREAIQSYISILSLIIHTLQQQTVHELNHQVGILQKETKEVGLMVTATVSEPWDQKPIRFQDAIGRRYPVPLEVCSTYEGLKAFLSFAFRGSPILKAVELEQIWLFTPDSKKKNTWNLIQKEDWESAVQAGMELGMSVFAQKSHRSHQGTTREITFLDTIPEESSEEIIEIERKVSAHKSASGVRFHLPLPEWSHYPKDARFQYT